VPEPTRTVTHSSAPGPDPDYPFLSPPTRPGDCGCLGSYHVVRPLGEGGMGCVFLAHDPALGRDVALKVMKPSQAARPDAKARFLREGRAAAGLKSDHVVVIYAVGGDGPAEVPFLSMEFLAGKPLDDWRRGHRDGRVSPTAAARVARDALKGLAAAHKKGLVHRDVKPPNLWVEPSGRVKLLDFGLARDTAGGDHLTATGTVMGTAAYMAPEQAHARLLDGRADLFSLGVVVYELLTGTDPFRKGSFLESLIAVRDDHPPTAHQVVPAVPADLSAFVARLMEKAPNDRPPDAETALEELNDIRRRMKLARVSKSAEAIDLDSTNAAAPAGRRRPWPAVAAAAVLAGLGLAWAGGAFSPAKPRPLPAEPVGPEAAPPPRHSDPPAPVPDPSARPAGAEVDYEVAPGMKVRFCWVPPGKAQLGSPPDERKAVLALIADVGDEMENARVATEAEDRRGVFASPGFWLAKYEVTQAEWVKVTGGKNPSTFDGKRDNKAKGLDTHRFPVEGVSWLDAVAFCNKASGHANRTPRYKEAAGGWTVVAGATGFRLPHEDEWEYACRGGDGNGRPFPFSNVLNGVRANCNGHFPFGTKTKGEFKGRPTRVGEYAIESHHPWGLCDVVGNVWEWCENEYDAGRPVLRGGSWVGYAVFCRTAYRFSHVPEARDDNVGLRLLLPAD
jgi:formylglycine-generating enzyme required for sulfatase activity